MDFEAALNRIGAFGRYQKLVTIAIGLISSFSSATVYVTVFTLAKPELVCHSKTGQDNGTQPDSCQIWTEFNKSTPTGSNQTDASNYTCYFDKTYYGESIITEWGLVCDKLYLASLTQTILMLGAGCAVFVGVFSDKYGRRIVCLVSSVAVSLIMILGEILQLNVFKLSNGSKYAIYTTGQFLIGFTSYALYITSYVLLVELTSSRYSSMLSNISLYFYVLGELLVLGVAYFLRNWHQIMWFMAAFSALVTVLMFFVPESPRYLVAKKDFTKAEKLFAKIAKFNRKSVNQVDLHVSEDFKEENDSESVNSEDRFEKSNMDYFKNVRNVVQVIMVAYIWIAINMVYFGVSLGFTSVGGIDPYLAYLLSSIAEIIGYTLCLLNEKLGRKRMFNVYLLLASVMCISVSVLPKPTALDAKIGWKSILIMTFASIGKVMASAAFSSNFFFTSQFFPTKLRGTLFLLVSCTGRVGSLISPQINLLGTLVWGPLPYLVFGVSSIIASIFLFILPEKAC